MWCSRELRGACGRGRNVRLSDRTHCSVSPLYRGTGTNINMFRFFYKSENFNIFALISSPIRAPPGAAFFIHRNPGVDLPDGLHQRRRPGQPRYVGRYFLLRLERPVVLGTCEQTFNSRRGWSTLVEAVARKNIDRVVLGPNSRVR